MAAERLIMSSDKILASSDLKNNAVNAFTLHLKCPKEVYFLNSLIHMKLLLFAGCILKCNCKVSKFFELSPNLKRPKLFQTTWNVFHLFIGVSSQLTNI